MKKYFEYDTKIGKLMIAECDNEITNLTLAKMDYNEFWIKEETVRLKNAYIQMVEYLEGKRKTFDLPLNPEGTDFQKKVWNALTQIPFGETRSYKEIAENIANPKACRAVGMANNKNPILIVIPCHRVIGANGKLVGYGAGLPLKEKLLQLEKNKSYSL